MINFTGFFFPIIDKNVMTTIWVSKNTELLWLHSLNWFLILKIFEEGGDIKAGAPKMGIKITDYFLRKKLPKTIERKMTHRGSQKSLCIISKSSKEAPFLEPGKKSWNPLCNIILWKTGIDFLPSPVWFDLISMVLWVRTSSWLPCFLVNSWKSWESLLLSCPYRIKRGPPVSVGP